MAGRRRRSGHGKRAQHLAEYFLLRLTAGLLAAMPRQNGMLTGELIEPAEVARVVLLLASPTVPSVIGADWAVDAGSVKV